MIIRDFNSESWRRLMHLREAAAGFERSNHAGLRFLKTAAKPDGDVWYRLRTKAEEDRFVLGEVPDPMAKLVLQNCADSYERFER